MNQMMVFETPHLSIGKKSETGANSPNHTIPVNDTGFVWLGAPYSSKQSFRAAGELPPGATAAMSRRRRACPLRLQVGRVPLCEGSPPFS